ncbi:MAG TPA: ferric reductase-like transmembrane domain-containing protein [Acidimicrobiia bacterium]
MNQQIWWYVARSSGIIALAILTASVVWGLLYSTRILNGRPTPKWLLDLHRFLGGLSVTFTAVHLTGLVADSYAHFGLSELFVPMASAWKPGPVAWGISGLYLLVAIEGTSLLMKRLPRRLWRFIHFGSYVLFWMAMVHGATAGTDARNPMYLAGTVAAVLVVVFLTGYRVLTSRRVRRAAESAPATVTQIRAAV